MPGTSSARRRCASSIAAKCGLWTLGAFGPRPGPIFNGANMASTGAGHMAAASVLAKVWRDEHMHECDATYPEYGFALHKGYGTRFHREQIQKRGVTEIHRKTWINI